MSRPTYRDAHAFLSAHPDATPAEIGEAIGCGPGTAGIWRRLFHEGRDPDLHESLQAVRHGRAEPANKYTPVRVAAQRAVKACRSGDPEAAKEAIRETLRRLRAVQRPRAFSQTEAREPDNRPRACSETERSKPDNRPDQG